MLCSFAAKLRSPGQPFPLRQRGRSRRRHGSSIQSVLPPFRDVFGDLSALMQYVLPVHIMSKRSRVLTHYCTVIFQQVHCIFGSSQRPPPYFPFYFYSKLQLLPARGVQNHTLQAISHQTIAWRAKQAERIQR